MKYLTFANTIAGKAKAILVRKLLESEGYNVKNNGCRGEKGIQIVVGKKNK